LDSIVEGVTHLFSGKSSFVIVLDEEGVVGFEREVFLTAGCPFSIPEKDDSLRITFEKFA